MSETPPESAPPKKKKTILIVDDHPMLRRGLTALIESEPGLSVCAEADNGDAALQAIEKHAPDLVIVDLVLEGSDGLDLVKKIKEMHPAIPALVLTMHDEAVYAERALRAGAWGYVSKQQLDDTVLIAIHRVLGGERYMSGALGVRLAEKFLSGKTLDVDSALHPLSDRELQVFRAIGQGQSTRQIADDLHLSVKTIESHLEHIKRKLKLGSATELINRATHWVETGEAS